MIRRLPALDVTVPLLFRVIMVGSVYLLFAGHNRPGGGFVGGLVAGAAISLRYVTGGIDDVRRFSRWRPWTILGTGVLVASSTALVPLLSGSPVLRSSYRGFDVAVLGHVSLSSALVFDVGVYLSVVGLVLMVFEAFGDRLAAEPIGGSVTGPAHGRPDRAHAGPSEAASRPSRAGAAPEVDGTSQLESPGGDPP